MDEFELIRRYWQPLAPDKGVPGIVRGIGDDCAVLAVPEGQHLVQSVDTLVSGVHFRPDIAPEDLGWRTLAVSASDLAAAGADPWCALLAITLPHSDSEWLQKFATGLGQASRAFGLPLVGGDSTAGPLTLTMTVQGLCPAGQALNRAGANPGDLVCVSGALGDAGEALKWLDGPAADAAAQHVLRRYLRPSPRLALGLALRGRASACVDVSDGLLADLGHILKASGAGATLDLAAVPLSSELESLAGSRALELALTAGDDYELCFTWPRAQGDPREILKQAGLAPVMVIGVVEAESGLRFCNAPEGWRPPSSAGYRHFSNAGGL